MARYGRAQPAPPSRGRIPTSSGVFTSSTISSAGAALLNTAVFYRLYFGATKADLGKDLSGYVQEGGSGTTHASTGVLTRAGHTPGSALLVISTAAGNVCVEEITVVPS